MTTPTPAQIAEGRDEALDHLGIDPRAWDRLPGETQRARLAPLARTGETNRAAVVTVASAERDLAAIGVRLTWSTWLLALLLVTPTRPDRRSDYSLVR